MEPNEASNAMRDEADHIMKIIRGMRARKSSDFSQKDLLNWLCVALQQHADFKMSMAEIFNNLSTICPNLQLISVVEQQALQETNSVQNTDTPPFDISYWMGYENEK